MRASSDASAPPSLPKSQLLLWRQRLDRYRQPLGLSIALALFVIALLACRHLLDELDPSALHESILAVPKLNLFGAVGLTVIGFIALLGYESVSYTHLTLPTKRIV